MKSCPKIFVLVVLILAGCAGTSPYMQKDIPIVGPSSGKALVYFMRPSGIGFAIHFQIWDGYHLIGLSQAKSYFGYECNPGKHFFIGRAENKRAVSADLEAGKTYYVITQVKMGAWKARMAFIPVTRRSEHWNKVHEYRQDLNYISPKREVLAEWVAERRAEVEKEISEIIGYLQTPEGKRYVVTLSKQDGR